MNYNIDKCQKQHGRQTICIYERVSSVLECVKQRKIQVEKDLLDKDQENLYTKEIS